MLRDVRGGSFNNNNLHADNRNNNNPTNENNNIGFRVASKPSAWKNYDRFINGIPFGDLVMIEKLIGNADFQMRAGLSLTRQGQTEARYNRDQRWTVIQHVPPESDQPADRAEEKLNQFVSRYTPAALEHVLFNLTLSEYREDGESPPPPKPPSTPTFTNPTA